MTADVRRVDYLRGLAVLELGDGVAGATAASMLWRLGADVTTVVDSCSSHRLGRPRLDTGADGPGLLALTLDEGKSIIAWPGGDEPTLAALDEIVRHWHQQCDDSAVDAIVVCDRLSRPVFGIAELADAASYVRWVDRANISAWVSISAFGLSGPRCDDLANELTIGAASGMLDAVRDHLGAPLKLPGQQCLMSAGQAAALAACHCLDLTIDEGPTHLDVSAQEAAIATGPMLGVVQELLDIPTVGGAARYGSPAGMFETSDGFIRILAMEDHQWQGVVRAMGSPAWTDRFVTTEDRTEGKDVVDEGVTSWTRNLTKAEVETRLQAEGAPAAAMNSPAEILSSPQVAHRGVVESMTSGDGRELSIIGMPFTTLPVSPETAPRRRRLRGLRVLEAGHVLAVPFAAALLGSIGARATKLEDVSRLEMYRRRGPYIGGIEGVESGAYFAMVNFSKGNAAVDLSAHPESLLALLDDADVVMENYGGKRASSLGLAATQLVASGRDLLACSSSGFGSDGPHSGYRAYAYNIHTSGGLAYLTRDRAGVRADVDMAWADQISGYALATVVAAWAVGPNGNRPQGIDFSMTELLACRFNEFLAAASVSSATDDDVDMANDSSPFAPHGVYRTGDGWIALAVNSDDDYGSLQRVLGYPDALDEPRWKTQGGRFDDRVELDAAVEHLVSSSDAVELAARLRSERVLAEAVVAPNALPGDAHLGDRGFFGPVDHPVWGRRRLIGIPWRVEGSPAIELTAPPCLPSTEHR